VALIASALSLQLQAQAHADHIIVHKKARTMELMRAGQLMKTYKVALGGEPVGRKRGREIIGRRKVST
jgi:hypothetical protein